MKVLGIAASPRRKGNSEILLNRALKGARSEGSKTKKVVLDLLDICPCKGCGICSKTAKCRIKDGMRGLLAAIKDCDGLIIASPIYFGSITAQLKIMIDRCQPIWVEKYKLKKKTAGMKRGTYILVSNHNNKTFFRNSIEIISVLYRVLGVKPIPGFCVAGMETKGDVLNNPLSLNRAFKCGQSLAKSICSAGRGNR